jgi:sporulation protein YlmC with PRC-barrel domain
MIRNLLATTAIATLVATAAYAQQNPATTPDTKTVQPAEPVIKADGYLATSMIGESVYNGTGDNAENIGDVNDIVLDKQGKATGVIIGVGGFLGIGEHNVSVPWDKLSWAEKSGDRWLVYPSSKEQLQALPEFDRRAYEPAVTTASDTTGTATQAPAASQQQSAENSANQPATAANKPAATDTTKTGSIDKSQLTPVPPEKLMTDKDLEGTTVYGANDENIGEINDVVLTKDGKVEAVIIDVGGFLGIGEKSVAVGYDKLSFMADKDGKKYLYTPFTKEQLEAQPAFDKNTFADNRDKMLMKVQ